MTEVFHGKNWTAKAIVFFMAVMMVVGFTLPLMTQKSQAYEKYMVGIYHLHTFTTGVVSPKDKGNTKDLTTNIRYAGPSYITVSLQVQNSNGSWNTVSTIKNYKSSSRFFTHAWTGLVSTAKYRVQVYNPNTTTLVLNSIIVD